MFRRIQLECCLCHWCSHHTCKCCHEFFHCQATHIWFKWTLRAQKWFDDPRSPFSSPDQCQRILTNISPWAPPTPPWLLLSYIPHSAPLSSTQHHPRQLAVVAVLVVAAPVAARPPSSPPSSSYTLSSAHPSSSASLAGPFPLVTPVADGVPVHNVLR